MTFKYNVNGVGLDQIFDPYVSGTKAITTKYTVNGVDLKDLFAPIYLGSSAAATNYKVNGADLNTLFAKKGTAKYSLPIDGNLYTADVGRGTAALAITISSDGTYIVQQTGPTVVTLDSGTWLPSGQSVSSYTVMFTMMGFASGPDIGGGSNSYSNGAPTASALTTSRQATSSSTASTVSTNASNAGTIVIHIYRLGVEVSTTSIAFNTDAAG